MAVLSDPSFQGMGASDGEHRARCLTNNLLGNSFREVRGGRGCDSQDD